MKTMYKGIIEGIAITDAHYGITSGTGSVLSFYIQLDKEFEGCPSQLPVFCGRIRFYEWAYSTLIKKGDRVRINGKIVKKELKIWQEEVILMIATNIYNENTKFGF